MMESFNNFILIIFLGIFSLIYVGLGIISFFRYAKLSLKNNLIEKDKLSLLQEEVYLLSGVVCFLIGIGGFFVLRNMAVLEKLFV